jgi:large subunit ribosomal protein L16
MLLPKRVKFRKWHKPRKRDMGVASRTITVAFGSFGLKALDHVWINSRQIEAARRVLTRYVRRGGKIWIRLFPDRPMTKKGSEVPMGGGKGSPDHYVCTVKPGMIMFEMSGITEESARKAMISAAHKMPGRYNFVNKV